MWHETNKADERYNQVHDIEINPNSPLGREFLRTYPKLTKKEMKVNSLHHQGVLPRLLSEELIVVAKYRGEYFPSVEALQHRTLPIAAVQYHPEELVSDYLSDFLITELLKLSPKNRKND